MCHLHLPPYLALVRDDVLCQFLCRFSLISTFSLSDLANPIPTLINFCSITGEIYSLFITQMKNFPSFIKRVKKLTLVDSVTCYD